MFPSAEDFADWQNIKQTEGASHVKSAIFRHTKIHILRALPLPAEQREAPLQPK